MARDRDDDSRDSRDDRPRRRGDDDAPKKGGKGWLIALIIVGGILILCGGIGVAVYMVVSKAVAAATQVLDQVGGTLQANVEANGFLSTLDTAPDSAYDRTTANFKTKMSKDQFKKVLADNPVLTQQHYSKGGQAPTPAGTAPNRTMTLTFTVIAGVDPSPDTDTMGTNKTMNTTPKPTVTASTAPKAKSATVTLNMAEQPDKTWKVDGMTVQ